MLEDVSKKHGWCVVSCYSVVGLTLETSRSQGRPWPAGCYWTGGPLERKHKLVTEYVFLPWQGKVWGTSTGGWRFRRATGTDRATCGFEFRQRMAGTLLLQPSWRLDLQNARLRFLEPFGLRKLKAPPTLSGLKGLVLAAVATNASLQDTLRQTNKNFGGTGCSQPQAGDASSSGGGHSLPPEPTSIADPSWSGDGDYFRSVGARSGPGQRRVGRIWIRAVGKEGIRSVLLSMRPGFLWQLPSLQSLGTTFKMPWHHVLVKNFEKLWADK